MAGSPWEYHINHRYCLYIIRPTITWTFPNGSVVVSQMRFMVQSTSTYTSLTISSPEGGGDSGTYICSAFNFRGVSSSNVQLTVKGRHNARFSKCSTFVNVSILLRVMQVCSTVYTLCFLFLNIFVHCALQNHSFNICTFSHFLQYSLILSLIWWSPIQTTPPSLLAGPMDLI